MKTFFSPLIFYSNSEIISFLQINRWYHWYPQETTQVMGCGCALAAHSWNYNSKLLKEIMTYEDTSKWTLIYFIKNCLLLTLSFLLSVLCACLSLDVWAGLTTGPWPLTFFGIITKQINTRSKQALASYRCILTYCCQSPEDFWMWK